MSAHDTETPFTAFERAQDAMIAEFLAMLQQPGGMGLSEAVAIVGDMQREMLCIATARLEDPL